MAIDNETSLYTAGNVLGTKPNEELQNQNKDTTTETVTQPTVVTPTTTTSAPVFNRDQRVALTLLPLASALLQGKTQGGQSQLSGLLASTGQGLAGSANAALQIAQLEAQSAKTKTTTPKQYKLQQGAGQVQVGNEIFTPEMGRILNLPASVVAQYPSDTFVEVTASQDQKLNFQDIGVAKYLSVEEAKKLYPPEQFGNDYLKFVADPNKGQKVGDLIVGPNKRYSLINIGYQGNQPVKVNIVPSTTAAPKFSKDEDQLSYKTEAQAKEYLSSLGVLPSMPNYNRLLRIMTTDMDGNKITEGSELIDSAVIKNDKYVNVNLRYQDGTLSGATTSEGSAPQYMKEYNDFYNKTYLKQMAQIEDRRALIPEIELLMNQLKSGELTTGFFSNLLNSELGKLARDLGILTEEEMRNQSNIQLLESFLGRVAGVFRAPGSGSTSDREFAAFQTAIANKKNTPEANYLNMYIVKQRFAQQEKLLNLQKKMLRKGKSQDEIEKAINEEVFGKPIGERIPDELIGNAEGIKEWYNALPDGSVIYNVDSNGNPYMKSKSGQAPIPTVHVKGFRKKKDK